MSKRNLVLSGIILLALALTACGGDENGDGGFARKDPPSASKPAADLRIIDQREVEIEGTRILSLSPDGQWLTGGKGAELLCIYESKSLTEKSCALLNDRVRPSWQSFTWSPDSSRIAFTNDAVKYLFESDLWAMDSETGELTNLTDDGVTGNIINLKPEGAEAHVDVAPAWSPDGKELIFARSVIQADKRRGTEIHSISASGGKPDKLLAVTDEDPLVVWYGLGWSGDGEKIVYTVSHNQLTHPDNGIWIVEADGKNPQRLVGLDPDMGPPFLMDVSANGDKALIQYYQAALSLGPEPNVSYYFILDLNTGDAEPLKKAESGEMEFFSPLNAVFSPDGSKILYSYRSFRGEGRLAVRDLDSGTENVLIIDDKTFGYSRDIGLGLDWAADDTIYVATTPASGILISLGAD